jgi:hypothetical protein
MRMTVPLMVLLAPYHPDALQAMPPVLHVALRASPNWIR